MLVHINFAQFRLRERRAPADDEIISIFGLVTRGLPRRSRDDLADTSQFKIENSLN